MKKTKNYAMPYPEQDDYFNVEDFQDMMVSVDNLMKKISDSGAQISSDAEHLYNQTKAQMDNIQKRMNAFTALKEGSTTGDAELKDIRVAYDGKEYGNAGEAVREQASDIHKALFGAGASIWSKAKAESTWYTSEEKGICILNERFTAAGVVTKISRGTFAENESTLNLDKECSAYIVEFEKTPGTVYMPSAETIKIVSTTKITFEANGNARCWIPVEKGQYLAVDSTATAYECEDKQVPYMLYDQANETLEYRGFNSTGSTAPADTYSLALEYKLEYDMDDTGLVKQINANKEAAVLLKEDLGDISKGHFANELEVLKSSGISVTDTVDGRKHNLQWNISSGSAYRGFLISENISNWTNKKIIAKVTNNSATSIIMDSAHLKMLLSHGQNWGSAIDWYTGELNAYETRSFELTVKDKSYDETGLWFVVGGQTSQGYGTANVSFELFVYDSQSTRSLNADSLSEMTYKQIYENIISDTKKQVTTALAENLKEYILEKIPLAFSGNASNTSLATVTQIDNYSVKFEYPSLTSGYILKYKKIGAIADYKNKKLVVNIKNNANVAVLPTNKMMFANGENWGSPIITFLSVDDSQIEANGQKNYEIDVNTSFEGFSGDFYLVIGSQNKYALDITVKLDVKEYNENNYFVAESNHSKSADFAAESSHSKSADKITNSSTYIDCYGDSLTQGAPVYGDLSYPGQLKFLVASKYEVRNYGIGGNTVQDILARQGAYPAIVAPFTIPADTAPVDVILTSSQDGRLIRWAQGNLDYKVNPVYINGIEGTLTETTDSSDIYHYTFSRKEAGNTVEIKRPTFLITSKSLDTKDDIQILWIGQNGAWNSEDELVEMFKAAINHMAEYEKRYICIGLSSGTKESRTTLERKMGIAFGEHYINIRDYLVTYGLDDAGISATEQDTQDISVGKVPTSLRADGVHFTADGYKIIAKVIYQKGKELGYWD